jgi:hypothetical protein
MNEARTCVGNCLSKVKSPVFILDYILKHISMKLINHMLFLQRVQIYKKDFNFLEVEVIIQIIQKYTEQFIEF